MIAVIFIYRYTCRKKITANVCFLVHFADNVV